MTNTEVDRSAYAQGKRAAEDRIAHTTIGQALEDYNVYGRRVLGKYWDGYADAIDAAIKARDEAWKAEFAESLRPPGWTGVLVGGLSNGGRFGEVGSSVLLTCAECGIAFYGASGRNYCSEHDQD